MKINCPTCKKTISGSSINVEKDLAHCIDCNEVFSISPFIKKEASSLKHVNLDNPPKGIYFNESEGEFKLTIPTRSYGALFLIPFTLAWGGGSMIGIYGTQLYNLKFSVVQSLFGLPFLIGTIVLTGLSLMSIMGKILITLNNSECIVFTGVGNLGIIKTCKLSENTDVEEQAYTSNNNNQNSTIQITGINQISFGSFLNRDQKLFVIKYLREKLEANKNI